MHARDQTPGSLATCIARLHFASSTIKLRGLLDIRATSRNPPFFIWLPHSGVLAMPRPRSALWKIPTRIQPFLNGLYRIPTFLIIPSESGRKFRAYMYSGIALISTVRLKSAVLSLVDQDRVYRGFLYQHHTCRGFPVQSCISRTSFPTLFAYTYAQSGGPLGSVPEIGRCRHPSWKKSQDASLVKAKSQAKLAPVNWDGRSQISNGDVGYKDSCSTRCGSDTGY